MDDPITLAERLCLGEYTLDVDGTVWRSAFQYLAANGRSLALDRTKAHALWIVSGGHLRGKVKDDALILSFLQMAMPGYSGADLVVYRGECGFLFEAGKVGFCWTPDVEVASMFARGLNAIESGGVLLKAFAPEAAILAGPNQHSSGHLGENEYTCNPHALVGVEAVGCFPKIGQ